MSKRRKRRLILSIVIILLAGVTIERIYNSKSEFQVIAEDAASYDIVEAQVETKLKLKDFDDLYEHLETNYPFFEVNKRVNGIDWLGNKSKYKRLIRNTKSDVEYFAALEKILGDLNDENLSILRGQDFKKLYMNYYETYIRTRNFNQIYKYDSLTSPFVFYRYNMEDGLGDIQLYAEDNLETQVIEEGKTAYMKIKAMASFDKAFEDYNEMKKFLKGVEDYEKLIIDIRGNKGGHDDYWKDLVQMLTNEPLATKNYSFFKDGSHRLLNDPFFVQGATTNKLLDDEILDSMPKEIKTDTSFYKNNSIRINPWEGSTDPLDLIDFNGKIYLIVDGDVFGQGENFASFAKESGFATLVGEKTAGGKHFETIPFFNLFNTKFVVKYSREMVMNEDKTINMETKTSPHIEVDASYDGNLNNDKCIQAIIKD